MTKKIINVDIGTYAFNPTNKTITLSGLDKTLTLENLLIITNVTDNIQLYNFADENLGAIISNNVITLDYDTTSMSSNDNIQIFISDTYSDLPQLQTVFDVEEIDSLDAKWYEEAREHVFASNNTPKLFINNLLKMANRHFNINISFDSYKSSTRFILPDIKIYRFMAEENSRRMKTYNKVISYEKIH